MSAVFNVALHLVLIGSLVFFMIVLVITVLITQNRLERLMRSAAIFAGALVALGAQASGLDYAQYTVQALSGARPASAAAQVVTTVVPAMAGAGIGFFISRKLMSNEDMAMRGLAFVGMMATTAFLQVYAQAATSAGFKLGATAVPNIAFTAGIILTALFSLRTDGSQGRGVLGTIAATRDLMSKTKDPRPTNTASPLGPNSVTRDPFDRS
jgi:hypothetical protein